MPNPTPARRRFATVERGLRNVNAIADACVKTGLSFHLGCALAEKESHGRNIYGHDLGGALSTGRGPVTVAGHTYDRGEDIPVTPANAGIFLLMIGAGHRSNGMGPGQITYANDLPDGRTGGFFRQMLDAGLLPWDPTDNLTFAFRKLKNLLDAGYDAAEAGTIYNAGNLTHGVNQYGHDLAARDGIYRRGFGFK